MTVVIDTAFAAMFPQFNIISDDNASLEYLENTEKMFGVFITIKRYQKIDTYPEDIHGCIGHYNRELKDITPQVALEKIIKVAYDSYNGDNRKNYFGPLEKDALSEIEISLMLKDSLHEIEPTTGIIKKLNESFDNKKYGIIVFDNQTTNQSTATYLPDVFENLSWDEIKNSILTKASIISNNNDNNNKFYSYEIIKLKSTLISIILSERFITRKYEDIKKFFNNHYKKFIPYIQTNTKEIIIEESQTVRNIATLAQLRRIYKHDAEMTQKIIEDINHYLINKDTNKDITKYSPQELSFIYLAIEPNDNLNEIIKKILYKNINKLEKKFERGEVLSSLSEKETDENRFNTLIKTQEEIYKEDMKNTFTNEDDIFQLNWTLQFIKSLTSNHMYKNNDNVIKHLKILSNNVIELTNKYNDTYETNYINVSIESLTAILVINKIHKIHVPPEIFNNIFYLYYLAEKRINDDGLYMFLNGNARIDITGHMLNCLFNIEEYIKKMNGGKYDKYLSKIRKIINNEYKEKKLLQSRTQIGNGNGKKNKILLTSPPNTGKSTALNKIISELEKKYNLVGFITLEIKEDEQRVGFEAVLVNDPAQRRLIASIYDNLRPNGKKLGTKWTVFPDELDKILDLITPEENSIVIIDEIAPMQTVSKKFRDFVVESLKSNNIVVGTIKEINANDFITEVKSDENVEIMELNRENRNEIPQNVVDMVENIMGKM